METRVPVRKALPKRLLIYGPPGSGKTTWASGAPNPVYLDYENSTDVLENPNLLGSSLKDITDWKKVLEFIKTGAAKTDFETLVIDTVSSMNRWFMLEHMTNIERNPGARKNVDRHIAQQLDFRKMTNLLAEIFLNLITSPLNVVVIAHQRERINDNGDVVEVRPDLPPAAAGAIEQLVNEAFYLERKKNLSSGAFDRVLTVDSDGLIFAKNRHNLPQAKYTNTTWKDIYAA